MPRSLLAATICLVAAAVIAPAAEAQTASRQTSRETSRALPFTTLGPLSGQVVAGQSGAWTVLDDNGQAVLTNTTGAGAIRYYATAWQGDLAAGRSASVRVSAKGGAGASPGGMSEAGLIFRLTNEEPRWASFVLGADGKLALYVRRSTELVRTGTYDIPGGHRPAGDVLSINQVGDGAQLLANGHLVSELTLKDGMKPNVAAPVGVVTMGIGEFTLGNFAFGKAIAPTPFPAPVAPPLAGNDDAVPTPAAPSRPAEVATLGPLGHGIRLGDNQKWHLSLENGQLVFNHDAEDDLYYFNRSVPVGEASGPAASVTVEQQGKTKGSGAGLLFGLTEDGKAFWGLEATGDGKIKLYHLKDGEFIVVDTFDAPTTAASHKLTMSKDDNGMSLFADGKLLTAVEEDEPDGYDTGGRLGITMRGNGRFAFQDFAFGPPPASPAAPPSSGPQTADADSLGPLGHDLKLGDNEGWTASVQDTSVQDTSVQDKGAVTYAHAQDDTGGTFFRVAEWPNAAAKGRSATVTVEAQGPTSGSGGESGGGLAFALQDEGRNMLIWAACGDGKVRLFRVEDDAASTVQTFTPAVPGKRHMLKVSQQGSKLSLWLDGVTVKTQPGAQLGGLDGSVGLGMLRGGRYNFRDFAFGPAISAAPTPRR